MINQKYMRSVNKLNELSDNFKANVVKFSVALNKNFSVDNCINDAEGMISRLKKFVEAGYSDKKLNFKYGEILKY